MIYEWTGKDTEIMACFMVYPSICMETTKNLDQDSQPPYTDANLLPPKYKLVMLTAWWWGMVGSP